MFRDEQESVIEYLKKIAPEIPEASVREYLDVYDAAQGIVPPAEQIGEIVRLLDDWLQAQSRSTLCHCYEIPGTGTQPPVAVLALLSRDWPGMADSVIGSVHEFGWNVFIHRGIVLNHRGRGLGVVFLALRMETPEDEKRFREQKPTLLDRITRSGYGSAAKTFLLAHEARKIEQFSRVVECLEVLQPPDLEEFTGGRGEAVKFFASRSAEYVAERSPEELAKQILANTRALKITRSSGGAIQFLVENFTTVREDLTGITISGLERDVSLDDCLQAVSHAVDRFRLKYNKEFTTGDGVTVFRIEIANEDGHAFPADGLEKIRVQLAEMVDGKRHKRSRRIESPGGFEPFAKAIIPQLIKEFQASKISQVYFAVSEISERHVQFKLFMVVPPAEGSTESVSFRFMYALATSPGLVVETIKPPREIQDCELNVLDLRADMAKFGNIEMVYDAIRNLLDQTIGHFRDFDEGMRRADREKLLEVRSRLPGLDEAFLKECYYTIEDFYRVVAPAEEIVSMIELGARMLRDLEEKRLGFVVRQQTLSIRASAASEIQTATLIGAVLPSSSEKANRCLEVVRSYDPMMNRIDQRDTMLLLFRLNQEGKPLPDSITADLISKIEGICRV